MKDTAQDTVFEVGWSHRSTYEKWTETYLSVISEGHERSDLEEGHDLIENKKRQTLGTAAFDTS